MLEAIDFSRPSLTKAEYKPRYDALIDELVVLQQKARERNVGLVVLFEGWDGAGKGSRISDLMYNLDARSTTVHVMSDPNVSEAQMFKEAKQEVTGFFPIMQEFWKALGPRGAITFYARGWYTAAAHQMFYSEFGDVLPADDSDMGKREKEEQIKKGEKALSRAAHRINSQHWNEELQYHLASSAEFERQLADDGYLVIKFFVHVTKEAQKKRLERLYNNPSTRWRVSDLKLKSVRGYKYAYQLYDSLLEESNFSYAPWHIVNGEDKRAANIAIAETLVASIKTALEAQPQADVLAAAAKAQENSVGTLGDVLVDSPEAMSPEAFLAAAHQYAEKARAQAPRASKFEMMDNPPSLNNVSYTLSFSPEEYKAELKVQQARLNRLEMEMYQKRIPMVVMYEGWDAAGKGGNIKRVAQALDARSYTIFPSPAPTKPELLHPHLWRYWTRLPKAGHVGIYDRSWYGRVLVERVEGFASCAEWARAYDEINEFESELVRWGAILLKFWVDVSPDEQLRRFQDRQLDPAKQWKITDDDWRNRDKYPQYKAAVEDMFRLTSTRKAPWILLESDDKLYARIKALKIINDTLEARLREK